MKELILVRGGVRSAMGAVMDIYNSKSCECFLFLLSCNMRLILLGSLISN